MNNQQHELTTEQVYDLVPEEQELRRRANAARSENNRWDE